MRIKNIFLSAVALAALAGCSEPTRSPLSPEQPLAATTTGSVLIECPTDVTRTASATIDLLGGTLELDGHKLVIPANAVLTPTKFTLKVPASKYLKIQVTAGGEEHFQFKQPVSLTLDYNRCTRSNTDKYDLDIWYVSSDNKLLENMGGDDSKTTRTVTTQTDHLSDYALGTP